MTNFFQIRWVLPIAVTSLLPLAGAQTITYTTAGVYTNVAPAGVNKVTFKLWGAGGGGGFSFLQLVAGGGGALSSVTLDAQPGDTFVIVVGQRGAVSSASLGGAGSGNTQGGSPGNFSGSYTNRGQGGQASSVFFMTNDLLVMKAVAGAGGGGAIGGSGGGGGQPGAIGPPAQGGQPGANGTGGSGGTLGGNYNANAITTGISALNLAGGNGGSGVIASGGGGGGYGGGGGGGHDPGGNGDGGGGGGGSYGTVVTNGSGSVPGNTADVNYTGSAGQGGVGPSDGSDGLAVVTWIAASSPVPTLLNNPTLLGDGSFRFSFTNVSDATFTAFATTNISASSNWISVGSATNISPGQFQFTDFQATNFPQRFYQIRSP